MARQSMEAFFKNAKVNIFSYNPAAMELALEAEEKGIYPCGKCTCCEDPEACSKITCIAWYRWFQKHWHDIQKAGEAMK